MKTILVPLDGTLLAEQALPYVQQLAPVLGAKVLVLRGVTQDQQEQYSRQYNRGVIHATLTPRNSSVAWS